MASSFLSRPLLAVAACVLLTSVHPNTASSAEQLKLVAKKSSIEFVGKKKDGQHEGGFKKFTCDCVVDMENHSNGKLEIVIDATSLWSDNDKLTSHLKNPDFFDVRKYPKITFKSTKVEPGEGKAMLTAELVMLGKKQEIKVPVTADTTDDQVILEAEFKIDRTKWGMNYGEGKIDNDVAIDVVLVFVRA